MAQPTVSLFGLLAAVMYMPTVGQNVSSTVGQLLNARGGVTIKHGGKVVIAKAQTLDTVREGDIVEVSKHASVQVLLTAERQKYLLMEGSRTQVGRNGLKSLTGTPPRRLAKIGKTLAGSLSYRRTAATLVRGDDDGRGPEHPRPVGAVESKQVTLHWDGMTEGALTLLIQEWESTRTVCREALAEDVHEYPVPEGKLKPGVWYIWSVTDSDEQACESKIRLVAASDAAMIVALEREAAEARQAAPNDPTADVLLAEAYEALGRFDKAKAHYTTAHRICPNDLGLKKACKRLDWVGATQP